MSNLINEKDLKVLFNNLNIPIEDNVYKYSLEKQQQIYDYLLNMNEIEKKNIFNSD